MLAQTDTLHSDPMDSKTCPAVTVSRFHLRTLGDPSALSRVVEMFVLRDFIPEQVRCRRLDRADGELQIEVEVLAMPAQVAEHLVRRMRQMPVVATALLERDGVSLDD